MAYVSQNDTDVLFNNIVLDRCTSYWKKGQDMHLRPGNIMLDMKI